MNHWILSNTGCTKALLFPVEFKLGRMKPWELLEVMTL